MKSIAKIAAVLLVAYVALGAFAPEPKPVTITHTVNARETLWEICGKYKEQYGDKRDIRDIIDETRHTNKIGPRYVLNFEPTPSVMKLDGDGHLQPGQTIKVQLESTNPEASNAKH